MDFTNNTISNLNNAVASNDAPTYSQVQNMSGLYLEGVLKTVSKLFATNALVGNNGLVIVYLTDNGLINGNAIFTEVFKETFTFWVESITQIYQCGNYTLSGNKKTLTFTMV